MSAANFHQILGVAPDATAAEIKRAYKRLAMRWHPDRNPAPEAHDEFRRVREAFERLTRPAEPDETEEPPTGSAPPRGEDRRMEIVVDLLEAAHGGTVSITIDGRVDCDDCDGSGQRNYGRTTMCAHCHGSGRVHGKAGLKPCTHCHGKGFTTDHRCPSCDGRGWHPAERQLAVNLPPAMLPGDELRVSGQGGAAPEDGEPGDLYLTVRTRPHPLFRLDRHDIHVSVPVSIFRLLAGGTIEVPALGGLQEILLAEITNSHQIRVPKAGFPPRGRRHAGDLVVHLEPQYPCFLSKEQKAMLEMAEQVLQHQLESQSPALAQWQEVLENHR
ncbi:DnaJ C-terminal domain-containing protein [Zoogloea sp. LCSB751]|uniref:DnaJ C-terminal domain-containing protein n=1 Tax=Zoogloea sp. LCSB751 TaxID=1965277 RepID=UPI0009A51462|nr:DnaJ C-terminal domain-containing protein [Zoogloea sp. LCSB751]